MATTSKYLNQKEYIKSGKNQRVKTQTNPRYRNFTQIQFTAGDEEQFQKHITTTNCKRKEICLDDNLWVSKTTQNHEKVSCSSVMETFRMLFHTTKKGIFCKIINNKLEVFLPFSKHNFDNGWAKRIDMSEIEVQKIYSKSAKTMNRKFNARWLNKLRHQWAGNSFLIRSEYPVVEGDSNVGTLKNMLETLCAEREIPDIEFFLNRRDFPLLRKDGCHPYVFLAGSNTPVACKVEKYLPVLSMCGHDEYADEKSPTYEDWSRICFQQTGIQFSSSYLNRSSREYPVFTKTDWNKKIPKAVFRGASTGHGVTSDTNPRLKLCKIRDTRLDVGITKLNNRPRAFINSKGLTTFKIIEEEVETVSPLSPAEQSEYKYIINVGGHSCAFRLSLELGMGSVILLVKNEYTLWFMEKLIPGKHYLEVESDLSNLTQVLDWCEAHQKECEEIASTARMFHDKYLSRQGILDYLQVTLTKCKNRSGYYRYNVVSGLDVLASVERKYLRTQKFNPKKATWVIKLQSRTTEIATTTLLYDKKETHIIRKKPIEEKLNELRHEAFVASVLKNEDVGGQISSFVGINSEMTQTYWKEINGITLVDYLTSPEFDMEVLKDITAQVCGILQYLQDTYSFCHRDLFAWNIMLERCQEKRVYANKFGFWRSSGPFRVVIIDFGKAHVIHNGKHHGIIKPYEFSTIQDIVTYIVSVSHILLSTHCDKPVLSWLFKFIEFLSFEPEYYSPAKSVRDLRNFLTRAKKYTEMSYSDKGLLERLSPGDLVTHIGLRVQDKRIRSPSSAKRVLKLRDDVFDNPDTVLKICKNLQNYVSDVNLSTFKYIAKIVTTMNIKKSPGEDNIIYAEIISLLS
jgi:hypothetical protein